MAGLLSFLNSRFCLIFASKTRSFSIAQAVTNLVASLLS